MKRLALLAVNFTLALCGSRAAMAQPAPERMPLRGHVVSLSGQPQAGVVVVVRKRLPANGVFWGGAVLSDARGDFILEDAEEGEYEISGEALGLFGATDAPLAYTLGPKSAPAQVALASALNLRLQVLGPEGKAASGQNLSLASRRTSRDGVTHWRYDNVASANGALSLTLEPGATLFVSCFPVGWGFLNCSDLPEGSSIERTLKLRTGGSLRLVATEAGSGQPVAGAQANIRTPDTSDIVAANAQAEADALAREGTAGIANFFHSAARDSHIETGTDGALTLPAIGPGLYKVSLQRAGFREPGFQVVRIVEGQQATCTFTLEREAAAGTQK
jgi:hypothetical protein